MKPLPPVYVLDLFPEERGALIGLLSSLRPDEHELPTVCAGWTVKDIAAHIVADDLGILSRARDGHADARRFRSDMPFEDLVAAINAQNEEWVAAARRLSMRVIVDLLRLTGEQTQQFWAGTDLDELRGPVDWIGPEPAPQWLQLAREYTERWHHQQQVRDALGKPGLREPRLFAPVLETFVRALPRAYREVDAPDGAHVLFRITGEAGGAWSLVRADGAWQLYIGVETDITASVTLDQDEAWRLFTKAITPEAATGWAVLAGDKTLAAHALHATAILA